MEQQTAVDWLLAQLENYNVARHPEAFNPIYIIEIDVKEMHDFIKKAKAMHKEQLKDSHIDGFAQGACFQANPLEYKMKTFEEYYNETYKKQTTMGNRLTQRIYECSICGKTPEDGEYMWRMGNETWCKECCEEQEQEEQQEEINNQP